MRVESLMTTGVVAVKDSDSLAEADQAMRTAAIRHLPVVDAKGHVVGMVSNRDLAPVKRAKKEHRVGEVMSRDVITVRADSDAADAADVMLEKKIGALPVVGSQEELIGIVTETDFLEIARSALRKAAR